MAISIFPNDTPKECYFCKKQLVDYSRKQDHVVKMYRVTSVRDGVQSYLEFNIHIPSCRQCGKHLHLAIWFLLSLPISFLIGGLYAYFEYGTGDGFWTALMYVFVGGVIGVCLGSLIGLFVFMVLKAIDESLDQKYRRNKKEYPPIVVLEKYDAAYSIEDAKVKAGKNSGTLGIGEDWYYLKDKFFADLNKLASQGFVIENDYK